MLVQLRVGVAKVDTAVSQTWRSRFEDLYVSFVVPLTSRTSSQKSYLLMPVATWPPLSGIESFASLSKFGQHGS